MGQEFFIKSDTLESKVRQLLPSQGGLGAGFDLSASTQIVPIVDLTESAEGSNLRQDLQTAISHQNTPFDVNSATTDIVTSTGYFRVTGTGLIVGDNSIVPKVSLIITDGVTAKTVWSLTFGLTFATGAYFESQNIDLICFLGAGDTLQAFSSDAKQRIIGSTRQIADIDGNLVNP